MPTENKDLEILAASLVQYAKSKGVAFVGGGVKLSIGTPVLNMSLHAQPRDQWRNGIFENGKSMRLLVQNKTERPVGPVSITSSRRGSRRHYRQRRCVCV